MRIHDGEKPFEYNSNVEKNSSVNFVISEHLVSFLLRFIQECTQVKNHISVKSVISSFLQNRAT